MSRGQNSRPGLNDSTTHPRMSMDTLHDKILLLPSGRNISLHCTSRPQPKYAQYTGPYVQQLVEWSSPAKPSKRHASLNVTKPTLPASTPATPLIPTRRAAAHMQCQHAASRSAAARHTHYQVIPGQPAGVGAGAAACATHTNQVSEQQGTPAAPPIQCGENLQMI